MPSHSLQIVLDYFSFVDYYGCFWASLWIDHDSGKDAMFLIESRIARCAHRIQINFIVFDRFQELSCLLETQHLSLLL